MGLFDKARRSAAPEQQLQAIKTRVIDAAFERLGASSFADLGGVWAVDGGYTFHALEKHGAERAVLVDEDFTPATRERAERFPQLELLRSNFGSADVPERLGSVDAVILFDVLLHQVDPDWDTIIEMYAPVTRSFVIVNPQYVRGARTLRLLDLGRETYLDVVPKVPIHDEIWDRIDEFDSRRGRPSRDIHDVWQWGIVDRDLEGLMDGLGFELTYYENAGIWRDCPAFENHAFAYSRV